MPREFLSFANGTSRASVKRLDDDDGNDAEYIVRNLERWGDRRVPRREDERGEQFAEHRIGWPYQ